MPRTPKKSLVKKRGLKKTYLLRSSAGEVTYAYGKRKVRDPNAPRGKKPTYITRPRKIAEERRQLTDSVRTRLGNWGTVTGTAKELFANSGVAFRKEKTKTPKKKK